MNGQFRGRGASLNFRDDLVLRAAGVLVALRHPIVWARSAMHGGCLPNLARPLGHDQLMQWRKLVDRNPLFGQLSDKLLLRDWAAHRVPELEFATTVWSGASLAELPRGLLGADVVLKATRGTGANYFPGRGRWSESKLRRKVGRWLRRPRCGIGEWAYFQGRPRLLIESLIAPGQDVVDLTFRCQDGRIAAAFAELNAKTPGKRAQYLTSDRQPFEGKDNGWFADRIPADLFDKAAGMARRLSAGLDHIRVDFFVAEGRIHLGELTVYSSSGFGEEEEVGTGVLIEKQWLAAIGCSWFLSTPQPGLLGVYQRAFARWAMERSRQLEGASSVAPRLEPSPVLQATATDAV